MTTADTMLERIPPQSLEAERAALGAMLIERDAAEMAADLLVPEDFYREAHRRVFEAMRDLLARHEPVDLVTLGNTLRGRNQLEEIGGTLYLSQCMAQVPTAAGIGHYAGIIRAKALQRRLIQAADTIMVAAYQGDRDLNDLAEEAERLIIGASDTGRKRTDGARPLQDFAKAAFFKLDEAASTPAATTGLKTPWHDLNLLLTPFGPGQLTIIGADTGIGKTAFAGNLAHYWASMDTPAPGVIFSLEMDGEELALRTLLQFLHGRADVTGDDLAHFDALDVQTDPRTGEQAGRKADVLKHLADAVTGTWEYPIFIDDRAGLSVQQMDAELRRVRRWHGGVEWFIVDYTQLVRAAEIRKGLGKAEMVGQVFRDLHELCRRHRVAGFAMSQLNREAMKTSPRRPQRHHLLWSSEAEQAAYRILYLYRPAQYGEEDCRAAHVPHGEGWETLTEVGVLKQRGGKPTGRTFLNYHGEGYTFADLSAYQWQRLKELT